MRKKLNAELIREIRRAYKETNATMGDLAKRYGLSQATISTCLPLGIKPKGSTAESLAKTKERYREMKQMREEGLTLQEIGDYFGISRQAVEQALKGVKNG